MKTRHLTPTMLLAVAAACSRGEDAASSPPGAGTKSYDVAGVRPGMSVDAARTALAAKGYAIDPDRTVKAQSWSNAAAASVAKAQGRPTPPLDLGGLRQITMRKGGSTVSLLDIRPGPDGGIVSFVGYRAPLVSSPFEIAKADAVAKYGPPTRTSANGDMTWCSSPDCRPSTEVRSWLTLSHGGNAYDLDLDAGIADRTAADKVLADAVAAKIGTTRPGF